MPWTESPFFGRELDRAALDPAMTALARQFAEDGFIVIDPGLAGFDTLAARIVADLDGRYDRLAHQTSARCPNGWKHSPPVLTLAGAPRVLTLLETLYGRRPFPFQTINFERGTQQRVHSDALHFQTMPANFVAGVWFALEDIDEANGALIYYPGSHRLPFISYAEIGRRASDQQTHKDHYDEYEEVLQQALDATGIQPRLACLKKGQAAIWAANLCHGGSPVRDPARTRHSQVVHYFFEDLCYYTPMTSDPFLGKVTWRQPRDLLTGRAVANRYLGRPAGPPPEAAGTEPGPTAAAAAEAAPPQPETVPTPEPAPLPAAGAEPDPPASAESPAPEPGITVQVRGVCKRFFLYRRPIDRLLHSITRSDRAAATVHALRDIDLTVRRGESFGIIGRNGSGKSTLLQIIAGILEPEEGEVAVHGRVSALLELGAGFHQDFTGRENLYLNASVLGITRAEIEERLPAILDFAEIGGFIDQPVRTYSSGMYVRLAFAVAVSTSPDILIVDEALAVGDAGFQRKCFAKIEELKRGGATILFVSHSDRLVAELCDRALLLHAGRPVKLGAPREVLALYNRLLFDPGAQALAHDPAALLRRLQERRPRPASAAGAPAADGGSADGPKPDQPDRAGDGATLDPELNARTMTAFESAGARIDPPRFETLSGEPVNVLRHRGEYVYIFTVRFDRPAYQVRFGMLVKTMAGMELSSCGTTPLAETVPEVPAGTVATIRFRFTCLLLPDLYFANAGVSAMVDGARSFLHRLLDAVMFRVVAEPDSCLGHSVDLLYVPEVVLESPGMASRQVVRDGRLTGPMPV